MTEPYYCADCGRRFFNVGWHAEACGSSNYERLTRSGSVPRCDYCGQLEWTLNIDGRVSHKHDCPHRTDDFCQAHPVGCPDIQSTMVPADEWLAPDKEKA